MGMLFRTAIVLGIGVMLIPADPEELKVDGLAGKADAFSTIVFAKTAYDDAAGFCGRNPAACETGSAVVASFGAKARTGAKWVYGWLSPSPAGVGPPTATAQDPADTTPAPATPVRTVPVRVMPAVMQAREPAAGDPIATGSVGPWPATGVPVPRPKPLAS